MKKQVLVGAAVVGLMMAAPSVKADHHEEGAAKTEKAGTAGCGANGCQGKAKEKMMNKKNKKDKATKATETTPEGAGTATTEEPTK